MNNLSTFLAAPGTQPFIYVLLVLDLILRGLALYKSARKDQKIWFIALLLVNSLGILPIIYHVLQRRNETKLTVSVVTKKTKGRTKTKK